MMIAIIVLGLGMVMVATVFPVAWGQARKMSEFTSQQAIAETAYTTVKLLGRVDGLELDTAGSFAGDLIYIDNPDPTSAYPGELSIFSDTRVHALHLRNILVAPRGFVEEKPYLLEDIRFVYDNEDDLRATFGGGLFVDFQIHFHSRVYPPLPHRESLSVPDTGWDAALDTRRFAWALFHRLRETIGPDPSTPAGLPGFPAEYAAEAAINTTRRFDVYPVTLRRPRSTSRYAQQDPDFVPYPHLLEDAVAVVPAARPVAEDVMFPVPWRVQVWIGAPLVPGVETGIPTEIEVPAPADLSNPTVPIDAPFMVDMFPTGAWFIDEISGEIYRVTKRRVVVAGDKAFLTLHREMVFDDVDIPFTYPPCGGVCFDGTIEDVERLRTVWVFPPPVEAVRGPEDVPVFSGSQPVVSIEIRGLNVFPSN